MSPPAYVQLATLLAEGYLLTTGIRDLVAPGYSLPIPGDLALVGLFGDISAGTLDGQKALALSQLFGAMMVAMAAVKITTIFTNPEGTYLRRNLMLTIGLGNMLVFAFLQVRSCCQNLASGCLHMLLEFPPAESLPLLFCRAAAFALMVGPALTCLSYVWPRLGGSRSTRRCLPMALARTSSRRSARS